MSTNYPGNIDNYTVKIDGVDTVAASHVNDLQDAVNVVETELGTNPKGSYPSLGAAVAAKAEKVSGAVSGNLAGLDSGGNLTDSGKAPADFLEDITGCNFTELADAPHSYTGFGGKVLKVNTGETAIEFGDSVSADEKVKADVGDATAGYLSEKADGVTVEVDLTNHVLQIKDNGVNADKLAHDIDATGIGFDADKVDGLDAEDFVQADQLQTLSATTPLELSNSPQVKASAAPVISIQTAKVTEWDGAASHRAAEDAVSGIIKGDGAGGYSAAAADTDYAPASKGVTNGNGHAHTGGQGAQIDHTTMSNIGANTHAQIDSHIGSTSNPHSVTANQVLPSQSGHGGKFLTTDGNDTSWQTPSSGVSGVTATSPLASSGGATPDISVASGYTIPTSTEKNNYDSHLIDTSNPHGVTASQVSAIPASEKGAASGVASLDGSSKVVQDPASATATPTANKIPIADASGTLNSWVTSSGSSPIGALMMWSTASAPSGWLICDGSAVSRTTYADLFSVIGTTFGVGDGSTTFNIPDMQDRFPIGGSGTKALASTGGAATYNLSHTHAGPSHTHTGPSHTHTVAVSGTTGSGGTGNTGSTSPGVASHRHASAETNFISTYATLSTPQFGSGMSYGKTSTYTDYNGSGSSHTHTGPSHTHSFSDSSSTTSSSGTGNTGASGTGNTGSGGSSTQNVLNPYLSLNFIIKY